MSDDDLADIARISESATAGLAALRAERDALKAALRSLAICVWFVPADGPDDEQKGKRCIICNQKWGMRDRERHAPGCLAAPEDAPSRRVG